MRKSHKVFRAALLTSSALFAFPALAQTEAPPPEHYTLDARGVDLVTGKFTYQTTEVTVGDPAQGGLSHGRIWAEGRWHDLVDGRISASGNVYTVALGGNSDVFVLSGGSYVPRSNVGQSLTRSGNLFTYTSPDGTIAQYSTTYNGSRSTTLGNAALMNIKGPNGEQVNLHWNGVSYCAFRNLAIDDGLERPEPPCQSWANAVRVDAISNNRGYQINFIYASNDVPQDGMEAGTRWLNRIGARGVNLAVTECATNDSNCGSSYSWPSIAYDTQSLGRKIVSATDQAGRTTRYSSGGQLTSVRLPGSSQDDISVAYDITGKVASVSNPTGTWNYTFTDAGNVRTATVTGPLDQRLTVVSDLTIGRATSVTEVVSVSPSVSRTTRYQYDTQRRLTRMTNPDGSYTQATYDERGNVTRKVFAPRPGSGESDIVTSAEYPATCTSLLTCNKPISTTDALGRTTNYTYDPNHGGVLTVTAPAPSSRAARPQTRITYAAQSARYKNSSGTLVSGTPIVLPVASSTCIVGNSCSGTANEVKTSIVYGTANDANNLLATSITTGAGNGSLSATTTLTYTPYGDVATINGPMAGTADTTTYRYDNARRLVGIIGADPDGSGPLRPRAQRITYDARGNVTLAERGTVAGTSNAQWAAFTSLQKTALTYDALGRQTQQRQQSGSATHALVQTSYDAAGRVECVATRMNPATFARPPASACTQGDAGAFGPDRITKNTYDNSGQLLTTTSGFGTTDTIVESASYNLSGQPVSLTDGKGNVSVVEYDGFGRMAKMRYPNPTSKGTSTTDYEAYTYDAGGHVLTYRNRGGNVISMTYDALGRQTAMSGTEVPARAYVYDNLGRLTSATITGGGSMTRTWDALGRLTSETQNPLNKTVSYQYDLAGRRTRMTWPDDFFVNYDYNTAGDLTAIRENGATDWLMVAWNYDNLGRRIAQNGSNGAKSSWTYDGAGRLSQLKHDLRGTAHDLTLTFGYNPAGQIVSRTASNEIYSYSPGAGTVSYANNGRNQVTSVGGSAVTYDARQNITSAPAMGTYAYDNLNQMTSATVGGTATSFAYDPAGRMSQMGATRLLYDGAQAIGEYNAAGILTRRHIPGAGLDEVVVTYNDATLTHRRWAMMDERGSVIALTGASAAGLNINTYDEYGQPGSRNAGLFQYTGQMWLPQAQVYHYKARVYAPQLGRFMQTDPIGYGDGANLYAYVGGDPVNSVDPWGLAGEHMKGGESECYKKGGWVKVTVSSTVDHNECHLGGLGALSRGGSIEVGSSRRGGSSRGQPGEPLPECVVTYLQPRVDFDLRTIRMRSGLAPFSWTGNSVTLGENIYFSGGFDDILSTPSLTEHLFHEIKHVDQWRSGRLTILGAVWGYIRARSHEGAWFEREAYNFAIAHNPDFYRTGAINECSKD